MANTDLVTTEAPRNFLLPADLEEWVDPAVLWAWIQEEVRSLDWGNRELTDFLQAHSQFHPQMWLCLLTYAYCRGTYESEEVGQLCYRDPLLRPQCSAVAPTGRQVM